MVGEREGKGEGTDERADRRNFSAALFDVLSSLDLAPHFDASSSALPLAPPHPH